jgi:glycine cleavage system H protein
VNPPNLLYAKTHEWTRVEDASGAKVATVGITAFAVEALTDLVFMELPKVGRQVKAGEPFGEIAKIRIADEASLTKLMDAAAYEKQCSEEAH